MDVNISLSSGKYLYAETGNMIINEIMRCLSGKELSVESAKYLLDEVKKVIDQTPL